MLKNTGARTKNRSWINTIFSHAAARDLKAFVVPGTEIARAYGLDIKAAGMQLVDSPRHASVLLIIGELTPAISEAAIIIYAQMMRPRAVYILSDDNYESDFDADVVTKISQTELLLGVKQLRKLFKHGSFTLKTEKFTPNSLSIIKKYTCPMHPEILQDEPGSCPKCGMDLVVREMNVGEGETKHTHEKPQDSSHNHKVEENNSSEASYTCPMHPEILQDEPGSCPKCGMFLVPTQTEGKPEQQEHMNHHENDKDSESVKTQYTCPMHPEVIQNEPGSCPKCGMDLEEVQAETSKQEHIHSSALKVDHSKMDHSKTDHSKMDHSKTDHSKMDHSKMPFMSMVDVTQDLPRSEDGLQMEWFDLPFGPFFPGLATGLFLNLTLDGDTVADCQLNQEYPMDALSNELPMHAGCFFKKLLALNPMIPKCLTVLIQKVTNNVLEKDVDEFTSKDHIATIEQERIISHLNWFCHFGKQTGMHNLARKAESLQLQLFKADFKQIMQQKIALNKFVKYLLKIPMLKFRTQGIGQLSATDNIYGPVARSMNLENDVRSGDAGYQQLNFKPILLSQGDAYARLKIRALEIQQSLDLITHAGLLSTTEIRNIDDITGIGEAQLESARGKMSLKMSFDAGKIQSFEIKTPSSAHIKLVVPLVKQQEIGDALVAISSLDLLATEMLH